MSLVWTALMLGPLAFGAHEVSRRGFRQTPGWPRTLGAVVLGWTWLTFGMEGLGAFGWLTREALFGWSIAGALIGGVCRVLDRRELEQTRNDAAAQPWEWSEVLALGLILWAVVLLGTLSLFYPVKVVSDGPIYHLYFAARWWKSHRLDLIATPFGENASPYFPAVGDLWYAWLVIAWGGDLPAKVGQVPFFLVASLTTFALARRLGASRPSSILATAWFVSATPFLLFSFEPNVDTILVAGYLLAVYFFVRHALGDSGLGALALGTLAASAALGTKATGIVFVPPLLILAMISALIRGEGWKTKALGVLMVGLLPLAVDGFWYGRNFHLTGNPLYPLHLTGFGRVWLAGWYGPDVMRLSQYYIPVMDWRSFIDQALAVFDPRQMPFWLASLCGVWFWQERRSPENLGVWAISGLALTNIALYWIAIPYRTQQRFMFHAIGLAAIPLARLFDTGRGVRLLGLVLLAIHLVTPQSWPFSGSEPPWDLSPLVPNGAVPGAINLPVDPMAFANLAKNQGRLTVVLVKLAVGAGSIGLVWVWARSLERATRRWIVPYCASVLFIGATCSVFYPWGANERNRFFPAFPEYIRGWLEVDLRSGPEGVRIAYAGNDLPYYLMGVGLRNEVHYINVDAHRDWLLHDYHREARRSGSSTWPLPRPGWDRIHPNYDGWLANLEAERIQLLVVTRVNPQEGPHNVVDSSRFPIEGAWARAHPNVFEEVYADEEFRLYKLHLPGAKFD